MQNIQITAEYIVVIPHGHGLDSIVIFKPDVATQKMLTRLSNQNNPEYVQISFEDASGSHVGRNLVKVTSVARSEYHNTYIVRTDI